MKLYNDLKLRFDTPIWALYPELALFDVMLEQNPQFVKMVSKDVLSGIKESNFGRKDSPTVEQVLRAAIYKEIKSLTYRELSKDMLDSKVCSMFLYPLVLCIAILENLQEFHCHFIKKIHHNLLECF